MPALVKKVRNMTWLEGTHPARWHTKRPASADWAARCLGLLFAFGVMACAGTKPTSAPTQTAAPSKQAEPTVPVLAAACDVLKTRGVAVTCLTKYDTSGLVMIAHFETMADLQNYGKALDENIGTPFCRAALREVSAARFYIELHGQGFQYLECAQKRWSAWQQQPVAQAPVPQHETPPTKTVNVPRLRVPANPFEACKLIHGDAKVRIGCNVAHSSGMTTMSFSFQTHDEAAAYWPQIAEAVVMPFCSAGTRDGSGAIARLSVAQSGMGRAYNCETNTLSPWDPLKPAKPASPAAPKSTTPRPNQVSL